MLSGFRATSAPATSFGHAIADFAISYAARNASDYAEFKAAIADGGLRHDAPARRATCNGKVPHRSAE